MCFISRISFERVKKTETEVKKCMKCGRIFMTVSSNVLLLLSKDVSSFNAFFSFDKREKLEASFLFPVRNRISSLRIHGIPSFLFLPNLTFLSVSFALRMRCVFITSQTFLFVSDSFFYILECVPTDFANGCLSLSVEMIQSLENEIPKPTSFRC
jgi:hypothetical protein